jgi:hypothetical protein
MAFETATYLVTRDIAVRSGLIESRYRIKDGRFVLNNRDLSRVRFTIDEYINGLSGVEKVSAEEAKTLIRQNNFAIGDLPVPNETEPQETVETENANTSENENVETPTETETKNVGDKEEEIEQTNNEEEIENE